jgi:hypothetical protein
MTTTLYANNKSEVTILCPQCGKVKKQGLATIPLTGKRLKIKCGCGYAFSAMIDGRRHFRKEVNLPGKITSVNGISLPYKILIQNISHYGIKFSTPLKNPFKTGDTLQVEFVLDNAQHTEICRTVVVKNARDGLVGAEFWPPDTPNAALGFYLMPA